MCGFILTLKNSGCDNNIRGLIGNQDDLKLLLGILQMRNSPEDIILLCETFLNNITVGLVNIPGYDIISNHQQEHKGGRTAIIIKQGIPYKRRIDLDIMMEKKIEPAFIEIATKDGTPVVVGSMYKPPNMDASGFITSP